MATTNSTLLTLSQICNSNNSNKQTTHFLIEFQLLSLRSSFPAYSCVFSFTLTPCTHFSLQRTLSIKKVGSSTYIRLPLFISTITTKHIVLTFTTQSQLSPLVAILLNIFNSQHIHFHCKILSNHDCNPQRILSQTFLPGKYAHTHTTRSHSLPTCTTFRTHTHTHQFSSVFGFVRFFVLFYYQLKPPHLGKCFWRIVSNINTCIH